MTVDLLSRLQFALGARYGVERELGHGGMATVYLARDLKHDREVALKVLDSIAVPKSSAAPVWDPRANGVFLATVPSTGSILTRLQRITVNSRGKLGPPKLVEAPAVGSSPLLPLFGPARLKPTHAPFGRLEVNPR